MASKLACWWVGASLLALHIGAAAAQEEDPVEEVFDLRACISHKGRADLSEDEQAACAFFEGLDRRGRYKALVMQRLQRWNQPPVAAIEILEVLPRRVDVSAEGSTDEDGFVELQYFALEDADTGDVLAGPITTKEPVASLETNRDLPQNLRVRVVVEDDLRAIDTAEEVVALSATHCFNEFFYCSTDGPTTCTPSAENFVFTTDDLMDAAGRCDRAITKSARLTITARGGVGGRGGNFLGKGGSGGGGGGARMVTTLAELDRVYKSPQDGTTYCYGLGHGAGHSNVESGAGGASTLLRTCQNVSQTAITGVLLVAGGGSGGQAASVGNGRNGHAGGVAVSSAAGSASGQGGGAGGGGNGVGGRGEIDGQNGVGGKGGPSGWGTAAWTRGDPRVSGNTGQGAKCQGFGSGGGGWGGGACAIQNQSGGGGSYAARGTATPANPGTNKGHGSLIFVFRP